MLTVWFACRVDCERRPGVVGMMGDTAPRVVWITRSGVLMFTIIIIIIIIITLTSAGMMWSPVRVSCGGGRDYCEVAGTQAPSGTNVRDLSGWDGEQRGLGVEDCGSRGIVVVVFTSL